jgi:DNA-binding NarL/FixJ family response regulator
MSKSEKKVVIIEDNKIVRNGFKLLIDQSSNLKCEATYKDCESFLENYNELQVDIILIDIGLPGLSGIEGIKKIKEIKPNSIILVLTVYGENELMFEAIKAGAYGCLVKNTAPSQMIKIMNDATNGKTIMSAFIARKINSYFNSTGRIKRRKTKKILAEKETKVLTGIIDGNSTKVIADSLELNINDLKKIHTNIYKKIHVSAM